MRKTILAFCAGLGLAFAAAVHTSKAEAAQPHVPGPAELEQVNLLLKSITGVSGVYCFPRTGYLGSINCDHNIRITYGTKLTDGGSQGLDGGQPLQATANDDLFTFPEMSGKIDLPASLQCAGFKFDDGVSGTCNFFQRTP